MSSGGAPFPIPDDPSGDVPDGRSGDAEDRPAHGASDASRIRLIPDEPADTAPDPTLDASTLDASSRDTSSRIVEIDPPALPPAHADGSSDAPSPPRLPASAASTPPPMVARPFGISSTGTYRSDEARNRSLYRRANPWYRRLARGLIALALFAGAAMSLIFGAQAFADWWNRDRLPAVGADVPAIGTTTILISAGPPSLDVAGTLTIDTTSRAFQFVGTPNGSQSGIQAYSPDGSTVFVGNTTAAFNQVDAGDPLASALRSAVAALATSDSIDSVLTEPLRRDFVDIIRRTEIGEGDGSRTRYELSIDTSEFAARHPLQWEEFRSDAIVSATETDQLAVTLWLDRDDVLVQVSDATSNWSWERLSYDESGFTPDPAGVPDAVAAGLRTCPPPRGGVEYYTRRSSCEEAALVGGELAVEVGLVSAPDSDAAAVAFTTVCAAIQNDDAVTTALLPANAELARRLHDEGVCPGDLSLLEVRQ